MSKTSDKIFYCHDSDLYWPTSIKYIIQWFPFLAITEHTESILKLKQGLITSLSKVLSVFNFRLIDDRNKVEAVSIRFIHCKKEKFYT